MSSVKTMLLRFEKNVTWKTPILFNSFFYNQVVTHWKLRTLLQNILWNMRYLLVSCYFIFTSTKLFIYLNYVNFSDKQLTREDKKTFSLLKSHIGQVKRYREQTSHLIEWARQLRKLTRSVSFMLRKALLNKTSSILSKLLIIKNIGLDLQLIKTIFPAVHLRLGREGYVGKRYVRKGPHNLHFKKHTIWNTYSIFTTKLPTLYNHMTGAKFLADLTSSSKPINIKYYKLNRLRTNTCVKSFIQVQTQKMSLLQSNYPKKLNVWLDTTKMFFNQRVNRSLTKNRVLKGIVPSVNILTQLIFNVVPTLQKRNNISTLFLKVKFTATSVRMTKALIDLIKVAQPESFSSRIANRLEEYALIKYKRDHIADWLAGQARSYDYACKIKHKYNIYKLVHSNITVKNTRNRVTEHTNTPQKSYVSQGLSRSFCTQSSVLGEDAATFEDYLTTMDNSWNSGETFKVNKGLEFIHKLHSRNILVFAQKHQNFTTVLPSIHKKTIEKKKSNASLYLIRRIKTAFLNRIISTIIKQTCLISTAVISQNVMASKISPLLVLYNKQILHSLPPQYASYFYYKDLTNILVCALTLRCSSLLSFYLARLYEHVPKHSVIFHVFNRVFAVFKFYCKAPLSLRVLVKGRVNRRLRKHTVCLIQTQVSTSAIRSAIDYSLSHSFTGASVLGIKVWVISFSKSVAVKTFAQRYRVY